MLVLALILAQMLNNPKIKGKGIFRTMIFLPCATSLVSYSMIFKSLFASNGFINTMLSWINIAPIDWFNKNHFDYRGLLEKGLAINATGLNIY